MIIINACVLILKVRIILHKFFGPQGLVAQVKTVMFGSDLFPYIYIGSRKVYWTESIHEPIFGYFPSTSFVWAIYCHTAIARYRKYNIHPFDHHKTTQNHTNTTKVPTLGTNMHTTG